MRNCDTGSGTCEIDAVTGPEEPGASREAGAGIVYFGDPMCSWCWGIAVELRKLRDWAVQAGLYFRPVMGGLRAGGGDPWNDGFRQFLRHHWREVSGRSGQPFNEDLLRREHFDYDTEPACRAVVTARMLDVRDELGFMQRIQHRFYVINDDPALPEFYSAPCEEAGLDFGAFKERFIGEEAREQTRRDFELTRASGVRSFPTILLSGPSGRVQIASGYASFEEMKTAAEHQALVGSRSG